MDKPLVACICLDPDGRPDFIERMRACFDSQTYIPRELSIIDTSKDRAKTIGAWRNAANSFKWPILSEGASIFAHFDWDDWSHPDRLAEQVELLQSSGKLVTGYRDMLFWDAVTKETLWYDSRRNYALGTSLCYRREAWERTPFPDQTPEDSTWLNQVGESNLVTISSVNMHGSPLMIQTLHGGNAAAHKSRAAFEPATPEQDQAVRRILDA